MTVVQTVLFRSDKLISCIQIDACGRRGKFRGMAMAKTIRAHGGTQTNHGWWAFGFGYPGEAWATKLQLWIDPDVDSRRPDKGHRGNCHAPA